MKFWEDLKVINGGKANILTFIDNALLNTGYQAVLLYRISNFFYRKRIPILHRLFNAIGRFITSSDISYAAEIDEGLMILHGMGVVIGANVKIGKKVKILNDVTLGNRLGDRESDGQPMIGDNVVIGVGSRILGPIKIGSNAKIGANSVVLVDVPPNSTAVGAPAKIIMNKRNEDYNEN
jgi:serine O-acetyltransferase